MQTAFDTILTWIGPAEIQVKVLREGRRAMAARKITAFQAVKRCALFSGLDDRIVESIAACCVRVHAKAGHMLFSQGDQPDGLYLIAEGHVRVWLGDAEGNELTLALLGGGDAVGEMALIDGQPRSASASIIGPGQLLYLDAPDFSRLQKQEPAISRHLVKLLAERLRGSNEALIEAAFLPLRSRLCRKLLDLAQSHAKATPTGMVFDRAFSQEEMARMLGVSREAVNRQIIAMRHDGHIRKVGRRIEIPDMERLARLSEML
ncbi:Crp/Fnr family transcriptional regulator [Roseinatronobacter sp.]|uniref:Crp/Fnr family transcriptional regulator n=1 Tax=Roseinatronobacter sp. TaxID=1945755 RepID=UPI00342B92E6